MLLATRMGAATTAAMAVMTASDGEGDGGAVSTRCAGRGAAGKGRRLQCRPEPPPPPAATGPGSRFDTLVVATSLANEYYTSESALDYFRLIRVPAPCHALLLRGRGSAQSCFHPTFRCPVLLPPHTCPRRMLF